MVKEKLPGKLLVGGFFYSSMLGVSVPFLENSD